MQISPEIHLSPIQSTDQSKLFSLMESAYLPAYHHIWKDGGKWFLERNYNPENLAKELKDPRSNYFFILSEGQEIGIVKYTIPSSPKQFPIPNAAKLHRLYLHADFHGKGIAGAVMEWVETDSKNKGMEAVWLEAMDFKDQAKRFYEKSGFEFATSYLIDFEVMLPEFRRIQIMKKSLI
jgi:GNAT superfamily N-acetyltransferase